MDLKRLLINKKVHPKNAKNYNYEIYIGFIGNCQTLASHIFLEEIIKNHNKYLSKWINYNYGVIFYHKYRNNNKINDSQNGIEYLKKCDIIIYQHIKPETSPFFNTINIQKYKKPSAILISLPSIFSDISRLKSQEDNLKKSKDNHVITVSDILENNKDKNLFIREAHPNTFLLLEILKKICLITNIPYLTDEQYNFFMKNNNYMNLRL
jgi:hypothetical protein